MRRADWLLSQLPVGMVQDDFFVRFVSIFQQVAGTMLDGVDNIDNVVDPTVTPMPLLPWLSSWIGASVVDPSLPEPAQRRLLSASSRMLAWRGTRHGLQQFCELVSDGPVRITDGGGVYPEGGAPADPAWVRVELASSGWLPPDDLYALIREEVPAHVRLEVYVDGQQVGPSPLPVPQPRSSPTSAPGASR